MNRGARSAPVRMRDFVAFLSKRDKTTYAWHLSRVLSGNRNVLSVGDEPTLPRPTNKFCQVVKLHALLVLFFFVPHRPPAPLPPHGPAFHYCHPVHLTLPKNGAHFHEIPRDLGPLPDSTFSFSFRCADRRKLSGDRVLRRWLSSLLRDGWSIVRLIELF